MKRFALPHGTSKRVTAAALASVCMTLMACDGGGPGPAAEAVEAYRPPAVSEGEVRTVENHGPAQDLILYPEPRDTRVQLLFMDGRSAQPLPDGRAAWADARSDRVVVFDSRGIVEGVLQGAPEGELPLTAPYYAAGEPRGVRAFASDGSSLLFQDGEPVEWIPPPLPAPVVASGNGLLAAVRTVREVALGPVRPGQPLIWLSSPDGSSAREIGEVEVPRQAFLGPLVNAGWVALGPEGEVYYAAALEPMVRRYEADGTLAWEAIWPTDTPVQPPRLTGRGGQLTPIFQIVQHGAAVGPDGHLYVLASREPDGATDDLLVFDGDGTWLRAGTIEDGVGVFVDEGGHVYTVPQDRAVARTPEALRSAFPSFALEPLAGQGDPVDLEQHRGKVVVVNFWASWCAPCRREMPLLDQFSRSVSGGDVVFLGLNEDVVTGEALAFLEEIGGVSYGLLEGGGRLKDRYGYRGLPYTVVLDPELRVVKAFYGFGTSIAPIEDAVLAELKRLAAAEASQP